MYRGGSALISRSHHNLSLGPDLPSRFIRMPRTTAGSVFIGSKTTVRASSDSGRLRRLYACSAPSCAELRKRDLAVSKYSDHLTNGRYL